MGTRLYLAPLSYAFPVPVLSGAWDSCLSFCPLYLAPAMAVPVCPPGRDEDMTFSLWHPAPKLTFSDSQFWGCDHHTLALGRWVAGHWLVFVAWPGSAPPVETDEGKCDAALPEKDAYRGQLPGPKPWPC